MNQKDLDQGVQLAEQVLVFAYMRGQITGDEAKQAICTLFGNEVESALREKFTKDLKGRNQDV